jgi:hypothetical protein
MVAKFYKDSIKAIEAILKDLDSKVRKQGPNSRAITTDTYAKKSVAHLKSVEKLEKMDGGLVPAFILMLYVTDASHNDCETTVKMCGFGDSEAPFGVSDARLLDLIEMRHAQSPATRQDELPTVPKRWTRQDADVGEFKTGRPNKQQYGQMERQKLEWNKDRVRGDQLSKTGSLLHCRILKRREIISRCMVLTSTFQRVLIG